MMMAKPLLLTPSIFSLLIVCKMSLRKQHGSLVSLTDTA